MNFLTTLNILTAILAITIIVSYIRKKIALVTIISYTEIDLLDFLKQQKPSEKAEILTRKLAEKACLLNYRSIKSI